MLYILNLLRKNLFTVVFVFLLLVGFYQLFQFNQFHSTFYFNSSKSAINSLARVQSNINGYFNLKSKNAALAAENLRLREQLLSNFIIKDSNKLFVSDSFGKRRYSYVLAGVVKSTTNLRNNFITIDKGSNDGIKIGMGVISPGGIVGIVYDVSKNFSLVMSVLNSKFKTSPFIPALKYKEGFVNWNGLDPKFIQLDGVSRFEKVNKDMVVLTSNYSSVFPEGIVIGKIDNVKSNKSNFFEINIKLGTDFNKLDLVYIVKDKYRAELDTLQKKTIDEIK